MTQSRVNHLTKSILLIIVLTFVAVPISSWSYNKSWDQGHNVCVVEPGTSNWGKFDDNGVFHGGYGSKECCELLCKVCPVYANTGQLQKTFTDLRIPGVGPILDITRTYNSQDWASSLLGNGWTFNLGRRLIITRDNDGTKRIGVLLETGEKNYYIEELDGTLIRLTEYGATYQLYKNSKNSYTMRNNNGTVYEIKEDGKLAKIVDRNHNEMTFSYNSVGCISRITNASGNYVDFQLGPNGKISIISDNFGRSVSYSYDERGNLVSVKDPMGNVNRYIYNDKNLMTQLIDARGNTIETVAYDNYQPPRVSSFAEKGETYTTAYYDGRTEKTDSQGNKWTYYFNNSGVIQRVIDPLGNEKKQNLNKLTSTSVDWEEDLNGNRTTYTYDSDGNILSETDALGNVSSYSYVAGTDWIESYTSPNGVVTRFNRDANGNVTSLVQDYGGTDKQVVQFTYDNAGNLLTETDSAGNMTSYEYDSMGNLTKVTDPLGKQIFYNYDTRGNKISETDANGNIMTFQRDILGRLTKITDPSGNIKTFAYDAAGNRVAVTDFNGNTTQYDFDAWSRITKITNALGGNFERSYMSPTLERVTDECGKITYNYFDVYGRIIKAVQKVGDTTQNEDGDDLVWLYTYDGNGNRLTETDPGGNVVRYGYDVNNRLITTINPAGETIRYAYDANGNQIKVTYPNGQVVLYSYDALGRRIKESDGLGLRRQYSYNAAGQTASITDSNGGTITYTYDAAGNTLSETDPAGNTTQYTYNPNGSLATATDREGKITSYSYNTNNMLTQILDPLGNTINFGYDANGNQISVTDDNGQTTIDNFDALNRLVRRGYADGTFELLTYDCLGNMNTVQDRKGSTITYEYDDLYRNTRIDLPGNDDSTFAYDIWNRITNAQNIQSSLSFSYDPAGRLIQSRQDGQVTDFAFDTAENTRTVTYPSGRVLVERYDLRDRLIGLSDGSGNNIVNYTYDGEDRILNSEIPGLFKRYHEYDLNGWLTRLAYEQGTTQVLNFEYGYDKEGHRLYSEAKHASSESEQYGYDAGYRLTGFKRGVLDSTNNIPNPNREIKFVYDGVENRLSRDINGNVTKYTADAVNAYTDVGGVGRQYDANGNLLDDGVFLYTYGPRDELLSVSDKGTGNTLVEYRYDALGRRAARVKGGSAVALIYDGEGLSVLSEIPGDGDAIEYLHGAGLTEIVQISRGGVDYIMRTDGAGSVLQILDDTGALIESYRYDPFGGVSRFDAAGNPITDSQIGNRVAFIGQPLEPDSGLYEFYWRTFRPEDGRFQTVDPLGYTDSLNLFSYAKNDPINSFDPTGLITSTINITAPVEYKSYPGALGVSRYDLANVDKTQISLESKPTGRECCKDGTIVTKGDAKEMKYTIKHLTLDITIPTWVDKAELERSLFKWPVWWIQCDKTLREATGYFPTRKQIFKPAGANWRRLTTVMVTAHEMIHSKPQAKKHLIDYFKGINSPEKNWCPDSTAKAQKEIAAWKSSLEIQYGANTLIQQTLLNGYNADTVKYESEADDAACGF